MRDIELVDIDYSGKNPEFKKEQVVDVTKIPVPFIVPEEGPFYKDSLRVLRGGLDIDSKGFKAVEPVTDIEKLTGRGVSLYIQLSEEEISSGGELTIIYQKVANPMISVKTLLDMLEEMIITGGTVDWLTQIGLKPKTVYPAQHSHDIQNPNELIGFGGLIELLILFGNEAKETGPRKEELLEQLQTEMYNRLNYIQKLKWGAIMTHSRNYNNPHKVLPKDVNADKIKNAATATIQQDLSGDRDDLYSTPAGFKKMLSEIQPVTDEFLLQSEIPFGYYGSGIYLPPPITGSFEGLGGDVENSAFNLEGNGWLVGLIRGFDGRVKNLYYIYNSDYKNRDGFNWINTYVQYRHPTITAANKSANLVISGSGSDVLMVGDQPDPLTGITGSGNWWITASNSTFDPNSHTMKPINMDMVIANIKTTVGENINMRPGAYQVSKVGAWVYLFATIDSYGGDTVSDHPTVGGSPRCWQTIIFRFPFKDLSDPTKTTITFTQVNCSFDNLKRERKNNQKSFIPQKVIYSDSTKTLINEFVIKFNLPVEKYVYLNRKKGFIIVQNPNNPKLARLKLIMLIQATYTDPTIGGIRSYGFMVVVNYDWDVENNTFTLDPNWTVPTGNMISGGWISPTQKEKDYAIGDNYNWFIQGFANNSNSWIPGYGAMSMASTQIGTPPYFITQTQINRDGNPARDYEYMRYPNLWTNGAGESSLWNRDFRMKSPFGVTGFPRMYSDLYSLTTGNRATPIEIFTGDNELSGQSIFYRVTEGGTGDNYDLRSSLQSDYIPLPIYGRQTNSNFGLVNGLNTRIGYTNRPKRKNATSRAGGQFGWIRRSIVNNPGAPYEYSRTVRSDGSIAANVQQSDGSLIINLDYDYTLDNFAKTLLVRPTPGKQVRIPRSVHTDMINTALGADLNNAIDIGTNFYIGSVPGTGGDQPYSFWSAIYHLKGSPNVARMIVGMFTWEVASTGGDGIRVLRTVGMTYPFTGLESTNPLRPGVTNNIFSTNQYQLNSDSSWQINFVAGNESHQPRCDILDYEGEGAQNMEMIWYPGVEITIPGDRAILRFVFRRRRNAIAEATVDSKPGSKYNIQYEYQIFANPQWGWVSGVTTGLSGGAINLTERWNGSLDDWGVTVDKYIMYGATYVEGNWSIFINADLLVTFNGQSTIVKSKNWDLRDLTDVYRNQVFYIYCVMNGSGAFYEITKTLRNYNSAHILVSTITTDDFGIVTNLTEQGITISGFPLVRSRDMGIPVSSGSVLEKGTYTFLKRSDLYNG